MAQVYYSNFIVGWLGLFQSPQLLQYAEFHWSWPGGWRFRWGDQQFWTHALWLANLTGGTRLVDRSEWQTPHMVHSHTPCASHAVHYSSGVPCVGQASGAPGGSSGMAHAACFSSRSSSTSADGSGLGHTWCTATRCTFPSVHC